MCTEPAHLNFTLLVLALQQAQEHIKFLNAELSMERMRNRDLERSTTHT